MQEFILNLLLFKRFLSMSTAKIGHVFHFSPTEAAETIDCFKCSSLAMAPRSDPHCGYP